MKTVYENIKNHRINKGLSQKYMAEKLGIETSGYGKLENGLIQLTIERLKQIADALEVNMYSLLIVNDPEFEKFISNEKDRIWEAFQPRVKKQVKKLIAAYSIKFHSQKREIDLLREQLEDKKQIINLLNQRENKK